MATVLPGPPSSGGGTARSAARSGSLPPRPSSGGAALVAALASGAEVKPANCSGKRDRLWLPQSAKTPAVSAVPRETRGEVLGATGVLTGRLSHRAIGNRATETPVTGDTIRLEDPIECAPTPSVGSRAVPGRATTPHHAATVPVPSPRPLSPRSEGSIRACGGRQRPASAHSRLHRGEDTAPAAGKRIISEQDWLSHPPCSPPKSPNGVGNIHDWGAQLNGEGMGWKPKTLASGEHLRHDPILHRIDVYFRDVSGGIGARETAKGDYEANARKAALAPRCPARRKGVSEFEELCALNAAHWDPSHEAALEQNRLAFHRRHGEFAEMYNNAARYPNKPRPFEPKMMKPAGVNVGFGCAQLPPRRVSSQAAFPPSGSRTRRPNTAGKRAFGSSPVQQISASPPSSVPLAT